MSYAVIRMDKFKEADIPGMQIHNQREKESRTNFDIDHERTALNYDVLHGKEPVDYKKTIDREIERRYTGQRAVRKDAVRLCSFMVTSDKEFFDELTDQEEREFFERSVEFLQERYGKDNIVYAQVHKDEKTPHMHVGMVPITQEGSLSAKQFFGNRSELQSLQTDFHEHVTDYGFELKRGEKGSDREHMDMQRFKAQTLKEEIEALESQKKDVQGFNHNLDTLDSEKKEKASVASKIGFKGKETVELPKETYEKLYELASNAYAARKLEKENAELQEYKYKYLKSGSKEEQRIDGLEKANRKLEKENELLQNTIGYVKDWSEENQPQLSRRVGYAKMESIKTTPLKSVERIEFEKSTSFFNTRDRLEQMGRNDFLDDKKAKQKQKNKGKSM